MSPVRFLVTPRKESLIVTTKLSAIFLFAWRRGICGKILDLTIATRGQGNQKRTKTLILCSKRPKIQEKSPILTQKCRFCARKARKRGFQRAKAHKNPDFVLETTQNPGKITHSDTKTPILCSRGGGLASGSATVAFLQITAHVSKT